MTLLLEKPHAASSSCWCGPLVTRVRYREDQSSGVLVVHDEAAALDPVRDLERVADMLGADVVEERASP